MCPPACGMHLTEKPRSFEPAVLILRTGQHGRTQDGLYGWKRNRYGDIWVSRRIGENRKRAGHARSALSNTILIDLRPIFSGSNIHYPKDGQGRNGVRSPIVM